MRPGPPRGDSTTFEVTVTPADAVPPGDGVPAVLTAPALTATADRACRQLLDPHLEPDELAIPVRADLALRAPLPVGAEVTVTATVATVTPSGLVCELLVRHRGTMVARGSLEYRVLTRRVLLDELGARQPVAG